MGKLEEGYRRLKRKTYYATKLKKATHLLFFKHHRKPGMKGWELKKRLGTNYPKILALLNTYLKKLDLQVKTVSEEAPDEKLTKEQLDKARFFITLRGTLSSKEAKMMGWRVDDIAGLAITISTIIAEKGKTSRDEVQRLLRGKLPSWKVSVNLDRYVRAGYIDQDEHGQLYLGWRTRAEVDEKTLVDSLLSK